MLTKHLSILSLFLNERSQPSTLLATHSNWIDRRGIHQTAGISCDAPLRHDKNASEYMPILSSKKSSIDSQCSSLHYFALHAQPASLPQSHQRIYAVGMASQTAQRDHSGMKTPR
jgi:hypothetical protein